MNRQEKERALELLEALRYVTKEKTLHGVFAALEELTKEAGE